MTTDPGAPRTDELARNVAMHVIADDIRDLGFSFNAVAPLAAEHLTAVHAVTWETDVNSAGVPVRRYVLRGAWEVDQNPPPAPAGTTRERTRDCADCGGKGLPVDHLCTLV